MVVLRGFCRLRDGLSDQPTDRLTDRHEFLRICKDALKKSLGLSVQPTDRLTDRHDFLQICKDARMKSLASLFKNLVFSRGHATLHLAVSVGKSVSR